MRELFVTNQFEKDLRKLPKDIQTEADSKVQLLQTDPLGETLDVIPSPINLFPPSPVNFGRDFDKNHQLIPISLKFFSKSRLKISEDL